MALKMILVIICSLFVVTAATKMQEHVGNEKSCVWHATDFSDGELKDEMFCIRFASIESKFKPLLSSLLFFYYLGCL